MSNHRFLLRLLSRRPKRRPSPGRAAPDPTRPLALGARRRVGTRASLWVVDSQRQPTPEAGAYRMLHDVVAELEQAASALAIVQGAAPDTERQHHLEAIRTAIETLRTVVPPAPSAKPDVTQDPAETVRDLQRQGEIPST
jgi:hypothetical protein